MGVPEGDRRVIELLAVSVNHRTAPIDVREKLWLSEDEIRPALREIKNMGFAECAILSTCNRTEIYAATETSTPHAETLSDFLTHFKGVNGLAAPRHFSFYFSCGAANHLFRVAAGIDSMIIGDVQILSQVKSAFDIALSEKAAGFYLSRLSQIAFRVGKRARSESEIGEGAVSVSYAAVELAGKIFADLKKRSALLIGAGETGELTATHLTAKGIGALFITNRTRARAEELTNKLGGYVVDYEHFLDVLPSVDIVVSSINAPEFVLTAGQLQQVMKHRGPNPLFIIDLGVPRNIDPGANRIGNIFLYDIDALNTMVDKNLAKRMAEIPKVERIIMEELVEFYTWVNSLQVNPTIQDLRNLFEEIRRQEVENNLNRFAKEDRELLDLVTKRIINKILHAPLTNLKNDTVTESTEETMYRVHTLRHLFGLGRRHHE